MRDGLMMRALLAILELLTLLQTANRKDAHHTLKPLKQD